MIHVGFKTHGMSVLTLWTSSQDLRLPLGLELQNVTDMADLCKLERNSRKVREMELETSPCPCPSLSLSIDRSQSLFYFVPQEKGLI